MEEKHSDLEAFRREWLASLASVATASSSSAVTLPLAPHYDPENAPLLPKYNPMGHYDPENAPLLPKYSRMGQEEVSPGDSNSCKRKEERPLHCRTDIAKRKTKAVEFRKKPKFEEVEEDLVEKLIADIDEVTEIPFFDTSLPREVGIKVFSYLEHRDLCHCAQVNSSWRSLADDEVLWYDVCKRLGYETDTLIDERSDWKQIVKENILRQLSIQQNWKERRCQAQQLQYPKGKHICSVSSDGVHVLAGYSTGEACLWTLDSNLDVGTILRHDAPAMEQHSDWVTCTAINGAGAAVGHSSGRVSLWDALSGEKRHCFALPGSVSAVAASKSATRLVAGSCSGMFVSRARIVCETEEDKEEAWICKDSFQVEGSSSLKKIIFLTSKTDSDCVLLSTDHDVRLHVLGNNPEKMTFFEGGVVGRQVRLTCFDVTEDVVACGVSGFGFDTLAEGRRIRLHDLHTGKYLGCLPRASSDILCLDIARSPPHTLISGCADKSVQIFDLRSNGCVGRLKGHLAPVKQVQMDEWKVVSGCLHGTVLVWDRRKNTLLWETSSRHPVELCSFFDTKLIVGNVPAGKDWTWYESDEDVILKSSVRGTINVFDFALTSDVMKNQLPSICFSAYDEPSASGYNMDLLVPYDAIT